MDWNIILPSIVSGVAIVFVAWLNNRNAKKTNSEISNLSNRNKAVADARIRQEAAKAMVDDATLELLLETIWTMHRDMHLGNGQLESRLQSLIRAREEQRQVLQETQQQLKNV